MTTVAEMESWLSADEDEHLEFKEARHPFDFSTLLDYCIALANERSGKLVLGVTDKRPRHVVGSSAFPSIAKTTAAIHDSLRMRVDVEEIQHPDGRVVVFHVPSRPLGAPLQHRGRYLMRSGEQLVAMTHEQLQTIFAEAAGDFTSELCHGATFSDLDPEAIERFRVSWDPAFLRFLERVAEEGTYSFATADLFVLDHVRHGKPVPPELQTRLHLLVENGVVERFGRGRGVKYILSRRFAAFLGDPASYTRERGLDRATNKELLVRHIELQRSIGCTLSEVAQVLPQLTTGQVRTLLKELKQEQRVHLVGITRSARWFPGTKT